MRIFWAINQQIFKKGKKRVVEVHSKQNGLNYNAEVLTPKLLLFYKQAVAGE